MKKRKRTTKHQIRNMKQQIRTLIFVAVFLLSKFNLDAIADDLLPRVLTKIEP